MTNKQNTKPDPIVKPSQVRLGVGVLALMVGVMGDSFIATMVYNGIAVAVVWDAIVLAVLAVLLLGGEE